MPPTIETEFQGEILTIRFTEARIVDSETMRRTQNDLAAVLEQTPRRYLLLDLCQVQSLSTAALGMRIGFQKRCQDDQVTLKLAAIAPEILERFRIALDRLFDLHPDAATARESFPTQGLFFA